MAIGRVSFLRLGVRPILSRDIPKTRRMFLPLLGERAGAREVVTTNHFPNPCFNLWLKIRRPLRVLRATGLRKSIHS